MGSQDIVLPVDFLLGTATAAHQVEGGLDHLNDYGDFTLTHPRAQDGEFLEPAGQACDHYRRFGEDLHLLASLGLTTYRFGIEWARIEPEPGTIDKSEIEHYREVLVACRELGITPIVTLHHFTSPKWLISQGGWESRSTPAYFARFARLVAIELGDLISGRPGTNELPGYICTINEVNTGALNETAKGPPDQRAQAPAWLESADRLSISPTRFRPFQFASSTSAIETIVDAHHGAVAAIKRVRPDLRVGLTMASQDIVPLDGADPEHVDGAVQQQWLREARFWPEIAKRPRLIGDFIGVQSYTHLRVGNLADGSIGILPPPAEARLVKMNYEFAPQALSNCLRRTAALMPGVPLLCTEFGIGTDKDVERVEYLKLGLAGVTKCMSEGIKVEGLLAWSTLDNFEWEQGFAPRFGVIGMDYETQKRTVKQSARFLSDVAVHRQYGLDGIETARLRNNESIGRSLSIDW